jgi:GPI-anchor transamidase subunit S
MGDPAAIADGTSSQSFSSLSPGMRFAVTGKASVARGNIRDMLSTVKGVTNHSAMHDAEIGQYHVYVSCDAQTAQADALIGAGRTAYVQLMACSNRAILHQQVGHLIAGIFAAEALDLTRLTSGSKSSESNMQLHHDAMRPVKFAPEYQVVLSLLNGNPQDVVVDWDMGPAVDAYLHPFFRALGLVTHFHVVSDIQHYAPLPLEPVRNLSHFELPTRMLPHFINSAEWNLAGTSTLPPIHLIVYVPPANQAPLFVLKSDGKRLETNAFLIPQWGGVIIDNPPPLRELAVGLHRQHALAKPSEKGSGIPGTAHHAAPLRYTYPPEALQGFMEIFISQLRGLVGIHPVRLPEAVARLFPVARVAISPVGVSGWELDEVVRKRILANVAEASSTLTSLATLIETMPGMVVLDGIRDQVLSSLDAIANAQQAVVRGDYPAAMAQSTIAKTQAEAAFFDPTMVSMLYFPDEHKFAVYMPFFVPVFVPLLHALVTEARAWRQRWQGQHAGKVKSS